MALVCTLLVLAAWCLLPAAEARWSASLALVSPLASIASRPEVDLQRELQEAALNSSELHKVGKNPDCKDDTKVKDAAARGSPEDLVFLDECASGGMGLIEGSCDSLCLICNNPDKGGFYIRRSHSAVEAGIAIGAAVGAGIAVGSGVGAVAVGAVGAGVAAGAKFANSSMKNQAKAQNADLVSALFGVTKSCKGTMIYPYNKNGDFDGPPISLQSWEELEATLASRPANAMKLPQTPKESWAYALLLTRFWKDGLLAAEQEFAPTMGHADQGVYENAKWNELKTHGKVLPAKLIDSLSDILCGGTGVFSVDADKSSKFNSAATGTFRAFSSVTSSMSSMFGGKKDKPKQTPWEIMQQDGTFKRQAETSGYGETCHAQVVKANQEGQEGEISETRKQRMKATCKTKGGEAIEACKEFQQDQPSEDEK